MKGKILVNRLGYVLSYAGAAAVVSAAYLAAAVSITVMTAAGAVPVLVKRKKPGKTAADYFRSVKLVPETSILKEFGRKLKDGNTVTDREVPNLLRDLAGGEDIILTSGKIRNFQRRLYVIMFRKWFLIECVEEELDVLCRHSNPVNIGREILSIAGMGRKQVFRDEDLERIRFAYKTYVKVLQVHLSFYSRNPGGEKQFKAGRTRMLYPKAVTLKQIQTGKSRVVLTARHTLQQIKMEAEFIRFSNYLNLQTLQVME